MVEIIIGTGFILLGIYSLYSPIKAMIAKDFRYADFNDLLFALAFILIGLYIIIYYYEYGNIFSY